LININYKIFKTNFHFFVRQLLYTISASELKSTSEKPKKNTKMIDKKFAFNGCKNIVFCECSIKTGDDDSNDDDDDQMNLDSVIEFIKKNTK
jgi:hypothetical protein